MSGGAQAAFPGNQHISIGVSTQGDDGLVRDYEFDDFKSAMAFVNRVGVESGFRFIGTSSIADPDGNAIELMEYGYSSMQLSG